MQARNDEIVRLHFENLLSIPQLAKQFGISVSSVALVLNGAKEAGDDQLFQPKPDVVRKDPRKIHQNKPISPQHQTIGAKIDHWRNTVLKGELTDCGVSLNMSRLCLKRAELGQHDFTLSELQRFSEKMGISIEQLLGPLLTRGVPA